MMELAPCLGAAMRLPRLFFCEEIVRSEVGETPRALFHKLL